MESNVSPGWEKHRCGPVTDGWRLGLGPGVVETGWVGTEAAPVTSMAPELLETPLFSSPEQLISAFGRKSHSFKRLHLI